MICLGIKKNKPKEKISQQTPDTFMRLLGCCFPQEKDLFGQGRPVVHASMWKTGYCDILKESSGQDIVQTQS